MKLRNDFDYDTRLNLYCFKCWICKTNGTKAGGIELHHIVGRDSNSIFNAAPLCHKCHATMGHSVGEERYLFYKTLEYLAERGYVPKEKDWQFIMDHQYLLVDNHNLFEWLKSKYLSQKR